MPMTCTICKHEALERINKMLIQEVSLRNIAKQIFGDEKHYQAVYRHAGQCLNYDLKLAVQTKRVESVVDPYEELKGQFAFAKKLRLAAQDYLSHPDTGEIVLMPRSHEVEVLYEDQKDTKQNGEPKRKTADLQELIVKAEKGSIEAVKITIKTVDIRQFALNAITTADGVIDKFARIDGLYTKDKDNPTDVARVAKEDAASLNIVEDIARRLIDAIDSGKVKPSQLTPEVVRAEILKVYNKRTDRTDAIKNLVRSTFKDGAEIGYAERVG